MERLNVTVDSNFRFHQRVVLLLMLVLLQFYSFGSDFFPDEIGRPLIELIEPEGVESSLDFDDNASLRVNRQEQQPLRACELELMADLFTINYLHELIHALEFRQSAALPLYYLSQRAETFVWFCSYLI